MSCNRENDTWQSADGTWNIGFYEFWDEGDPSDDDWDYEWDVEYGENFHWISTGHATPDEAYASYTRSHANPGGTCITEFTPANEKQVAAFEAKAAEAKAAGVKDSRFDSGGLGGFRYTYIR